MSDESNQPTEPASTPVELKPVDIAAEIVADAPQATAPAPARQGDPKPAPVAESAGSVKKDAAPSPTGEKDSAGVVFDPAKHNRTKNRHTGRWMPKGGRKKKAVESVASRPGESAWSATERQQATGAAAPVPGEAQPSGEGSVPDGGESKSKDVPTADPEQMGSVAARVLYSATGAVTGEPGEAEMAGKDHEEIKGQFASVVRWRGWHVTGWAAVAMTIVFYFSHVLGKPKTSAKVSGWWDKFRSDRAKPVEPVEEEKPKEPHPARRAPPVAAAPNVPQRGEFDHLKNIGG
jgi:hypothetical protein